MRDPMLDAGGAYLTAYRKAGNAGRREVPELPEAEDIVSGLIGWCGLLLRDTETIEHWEEGRALSDLLVLPPDRSPLQAFKEIADVNRRDLHRNAFAALVEGRERRDTNVMAWLLGKALAKVLIACLESSDEMPKCPVAGFQRFASSHDVTHFAFEESLQTLLCEHPSALAGILFDLERHVETIMHDPGIGTYTSERKAFNHAIEAWRSKRSISELWKMREHWVPVRYSELETVSCIVSVDRAAVLERLDRFDFPHPVRQVLEHRAILHDRDEISALLEAAPSSSEDGRTWNHRLSTLLVLATAESHCHELWRAARRVHEQGGDANADAGILEETEATLFSWLEELAAIVMARSDGTFLGSQWLLLKVADERMDRTRRRHAVDRGRNELRQDDLIEWIALGLSKAGLQGREIEALVEFPESSGLDYVSPVKAVSSGDRQETPRLGALAMSVLLDHMIGEASSNEVEKCLEQLDALLAFRDPAFEVEAIVSPDARGLPANCCGFLFANANDPVELWQQSWSLIIEQRRRVQHWHETKDGDALAPSLFLLAAGMSAIEWLISSQDRDSSKERKLWRAVFDGARECWLTILLAPFSGQIEVHLGRLFALHPRVFDASPVGNDVCSDLEGTVVDEGYSECLARDLSALGGNDLMLVVCFLNAAHNGASLGAMHEVLKWHEGHVDDVLRQFEKWQEVERSPRRNPDLVQELAELRTELAQSAIA